MTTDTMADTRNETSAGESHVLDVSDDGGQTWWATELVVTEMIAGDIDLAVVALNDGKIVRLPGGIWLRARR